MSDGAVPSESETGFDLFVSYSRADSGTTAEEIVVDLERRGLRCWIAPRDIPAGTTSWAAEIIRNIRNTNSFMLLLSSGANASTEIEKELNEAARQRKPIFAIRLSEIEPSDGLGYHLNSVQWRDLFRNREDVLNEIAARVKSLRGASLKSSLSGYVSPPAETAPKAELQLASPPLVVARSKSRNFLAVSLAAFTGIAGAALGWGITSMNRAPADKAPVQISTPTIDSSDVEKRRVEMENAARQKAEVEARVIVEAKLAAEAKAAAELKVAEEKRIEDAKAAEAKAADIKAAEVKSAAEAKARLEAKAAADAKTAETARLAAEAKREADAKLAAEARSTVETEKAKGAVNRVETVLPATPPPAAAEPTNQQAPVIKSESLKPRKPKPVSAEPDDKPVRTRIKREPVAKILRPIETPRPKSNSSPKSRSGGSRQSCCAKIGGKWELNTDGSGVGECYYRGPSQRESYGSCVHGR